MCVSVKKQNKTPETLKCTSWSLAPPAHAPLTDLSKDAPPRPDFISQHAPALVLVKPHCGQANVNRFGSSAAAVVTAQTRQHGRCQSLRVTAALMN